MSFANPPQAQITALLRSSRNIAVIGLSANPERPSHRVARWLQHYGYRVLPVTPLHHRVLGEPAYQSLEQLVTRMPAGERIDIVDVFRRSEHVAAIVEDCVRLELPALWLQMGVIDEVAAMRARAAGMFVVMDRCIYRERAALPG